MADSAAKPFAEVSPEHMTSIGGCKLTEKSRMGGTLADSKNLPFPNRHLLDAFALVITVFATQMVLMLAALAFLQHAG